MKTMIPSFQKVLLALSTFFIFQAVSSQTPVADFTGPADVLIQEVACVSLTIWNVGDAGYQPYVRLFVPPEVPVNSLMVRFMGDDLNTVVNAGVFSGGTLGDPNLGDELPENDVTGPTGYSFVVVNLPVGSMVEDGVDLQLEVCGSLSGSGVEVDVPVEFQAQVVYRYGDSPTGENGPIEGSVYATQVTPILYRLSKSTNFSAQPAGVCWPMEYAVTVDIADGEIMAHTDSRGEFIYNIDLSRRRAISVQKWLISNGVDKDRLQSNGYGSTIPKVRCGSGQKCTEDDHARNRRVEFRIIDDGQQIDVLSRERATNTASRR